MELGASVVCPFFFNECRGDDADHCAACGQRGFGHQAHQAVAPSAIDQLATVRADPGANLHRDLRKFGLVAGLGAAVNANREGRFRYLDGVGRVHGLFIWQKPAGCQPRRRARTGAGGESG